MTVSTHILDTARGTPADGVRVTLEREMETGVWAAVGSGRTDRGGRLREWLDAIDVGPGIYRLVFDTREYFERQDTSSLFPCVTIVFEIAAGESHYHIPLLLSPFGYATYRGS